MKNVIAYAQIKFLLSMILIVYTSGWLYGQDAFSNLMRDHNLIKSREAKREINYESISGSPYYSANYVKSIVYTPNGDSAVADLRYDLYLNEMEFKNDKSTLWLLKNQVGKIVYGNDELVVDDAMGSKSKVYYFLIEEGKFSLMRRKFVVFLPAEPPRAYADPVPDRFESESDVFYIKKDNLAPKVAMTKKDIDDLIAGNNTAIEFVKKQKIKAGKEEDMVELVQFLNSLN